jgi:hypothetical protein
MRFGGRFALLFASTLVFGCSASEFSAPDSGASADATTDGSGGDAGADASPLSGLPPGLRAYWRFENDGVDATGDVGQTMILTQTSFVDGVKGKALRCGGSGQAQATNANKNFNLGAGSATFIAWVRFDKDADGGFPVRQTILSKNKNWTTSASTGPGYALGVVTAPLELRGTVGNGVNVSEANANAPAAMLDGAFHMVAYVIDVSATSLSLYVDGAYLGQQTITNPLTFDSPAPLVLCAGSGLPLLGSLDEVMMFGRALSLEEIVAVKTRIAP